jgi:hypothetical protein
MIFELKKIQAPSQYITSYCDGVIPMEMKGIKMQAQWPGEVRQREMMLKQWGK